MGQPKPEIVRFIPPEASRGADAIEEAFGPAEWDDFYIENPLPGTPEHQAKMQVLAFFNELVLDSWEGLEHSRFSECLNREAIPELKAQLVRCGLTEKAADTLAEHLPCQYLVDLDQAHSASRPATIRGHLEAIRDAARALERALKAAALEAPGALAKLKDAVRDEVADIRCDESPLRVTQEMFFRNPRTIFALGDLADGARAVLDRLPEDSGGQVAGEHDSTGASARKGLTMRIRRGLRTLGLKSGSQPRGPIAELLRNIHKAAGGQDSGKEPSWAKKYAADAPSWEEEALGQENSSEDSWLAHEGWILDPNGTYQAGRNLRLGKYRSETRECD